MIHCGNCLKEYQEAMAYFGKLFKENMKLKEENRELKEELKTLKSLINKWDTFCNEGI